MICPECKQLVCICPLTPEQEARAKGWAQYMALPKSVRAKAVPPGCFTCGAPSVGRERDGMPGYRCGPHPAKRAMRPREGVPA